MSKLTDPIAPDLHVVVHSRRVFGNGSQRECPAGPELWEVIVAGPMAWHAAQDVWAALDAERRTMASTTSRRAQGYYKVRSVSDPAVAPLLKGCSFHTSAVSAARAWGKANGLAADAGGWVRGVCGRPVHGWKAAVIHMVAQSYIASAWHPTSGRICWANYGAPVVRSLMPERV